MSADDQKEQLKQIFSKRVTTQARIVLDIYQKWITTLSDDGEWLIELEDAAEKLEKFAKRFDRKDHEKSAQKVITTLAKHRNEPNKLRHALADTMQALGACTRRKTDLVGAAENHLNNSRPRTYLRTPIYVAIEDPEYTKRLINQLEFFGFRSITFTHPDELIKAAKHDKPETIILDVGFGGGEHSGITTSERIQSEHESPIPIIYISQGRDDIETRLLASRTGGEEFFLQNVDPGQLIEKIEQYTQASPQDPYRVLVVDDSQSQAKYIENVLAKAKMDAVVINDPLQVLIALEEFQPEIIIMDMYMPGCTGMELARVIRQQNKFHSVPIIYLSAEDDVNKQLHAMSLGGDDFLTKPISPRHLISTIQNRGRRARSLLALMVRDSLTGLYNHTHILHLLEAELNKAQKKHTPLAYVMLDIDYFKKINDSYGHPVGDRVLKSLSLFLKQRLRKTDHIGRYGGEEFALILPNTSERDAKIILNEIREKFAELPQPVGDTSFTVTFSAGLALCHGESAQALCEKADQALYQAKRRGRNNISCYNQEAERRAL